MAQIKAAGFHRIDTPEVKLPGITKIIMLGDPGCTRFTEDSKEILGQILCQEADAFFILGDLAFMDADEELREMISFCNSRVKVPIFALCGNHELSSYSRFLGLASYALVLEHLVCFFLMDATGHFLEDDLDLLRKKLREHEDKKFIVLMHIPPPTDVSRKSLRPEEWEKLKTVLEPHKDKIQHLFCGHIHGFHQYEIDGYPVTITAGGGSAMIHQLAMPARKLYHSVEVSIHKDKPLSLRVIPVERMP